MKTILFILIQTFLFLNAYPQSGKLVLKIENEKNVPTVENAVKNGELRLKSSNAVLNHTFGKYKVYELKKLYPSSRRPELLKYYILETDKHKELITELKTKHGQIFSEVSEIVEPQPLYIPNDFSFTLISGEDSIREISLSYLDYINLPDAWEITKGDPNIIVGIHDNHLFAEHEDLEGKIVKIYDENIRSTFAYQQDHGTQVAGIIAANTDNNKGISSVAYNCRLAKTSKNHDDLLKMAQEGVKVINISQDWGYYRPDHQELINELTEDYGVTIVAAAGNKDDTKYIYPASYENVISVTSVGHEFARGTSVEGTKVNWKDCHRKYIDRTGNSTCHQHNDKVDICAPGYSLLTLCNPQANKNGLNDLSTQLYCVVDGTSFACAIVAGVCALMYSANPDLSPEDIEEIIKVTAVNIDTIPENAPYKGLLGAGRIDAYEAVKMAECWPNCSTVNPLVSIHENNLTVDFKVFPNPATDYISLEFNVSEERTVEIISINGAVIYKTKIHGNLHGLNLPDINPGVYFVRVTSESSQHTKRIMKL